MTGILNALIAGVSGAVKDAYFNLVSLLLPGNGTNGAQNNTFLDSSGNTFTITRNGNTTQGTFSPFSQTGWGNYFDGSTAYLTAAANSAINDFGTGDFNIELWFYATTSNFTAEPTLISCVVTWATSVAYQLEIRSGGVVYFFGGDSVPISINSGATTVSVNTWNHVAVSRASGTTRLFVNGTQTSSTSTVATISKSSTAVSIGAFSVAATQKFTGYISNVRIVKGQALYTGNFTPPIEALTTTSVGTSGANVATSVTGTVGLLTCQSNRFFDQTGKTITANGSPSVTPFSPFATTQSYSAAAVGGSGYFDGTGDYLQVAANTNLNFGTGNFTVESWVYTGSTGTLYFAIGDATGDGFFSYESGNFSLGRRGIASDVATSGFTMPQNQWAHVVFTRAGTGTNQTRIFVNGVLRGVGTTAQSYNFTTNISIVGGTFGSWPGYFTNLRFVKGSVVSAYSTSSTTVGDVIFTPPTAPLTAITDTQLLLNFTNAGVVDATAKNVLETVGNAQISTTQSKWGGGSMRFPQSGTTDYLKEPLTDLLKIGSGDYTFECWLYRNNSDDAALYVNRSTAQDGFLFGIRTNKVFMLVSQDGSAWAINTYVTTQGNSVPTTTWSHIAISRQGSSWRVFIDGTLSYTSTLSGSVFQNQPFVYVGYDSGVTALNGYIDDLRVTKGYARYVEGTGGNAGKMVFNGTNTLALPTAPFPVQ